MVEKGAQVKLRRQLESLWVEHDQMKADQQAKVLELESLTWNHEKSRDHELELKGCLETSRAELAGRFMIYDLGGEGGRGEWGMICISTLTLSENLVNF